MSPDILEILFNLTPQVLSCWFSSFVVRVQMSSSMLCPGAFSLLLHVPVLGPSESSCLLGTFE